MNFDAVTYAMDKLEPNTNEQDNIRKAEVLQRIEQAMGVTFSEEQKAVIVHTGSPLAVISCAGSGKTTVVIAKLFFRELYYGVPAYQLLAISFNTKAKVELEERYHKIKLQLGIHTQGNPTFKTFHGLFYSFITRFKRQLKVVSEGAYTYELLKEIPYSQYRDKKEILQQILDKRSNLINNNLSYDGIHTAAIEGALVQVTEEGLDEETYFKVIHKYNELKHRRGEIDFDDMLVFMHQMTVQQPNSQLIAAFQQAFHEVYIDEYQDSSEIIINIMDVLIGDKNKFTVIGDDDQNIYSYRGSKNYFILNFHLRYMGATTLFLGDNYRCPAAILNPVITCIEHNEKRLAKSLRANYEGGELYFYPLKNSYDNLLEALLDEVEMANGALDKIAVLVRLNAQKMIISDLLAEQNIPVDVGNAYFSLQENKVYKSIIGIIKAIRTKDNLLFAEFGRQFLPSINYVVFKRYREGVVQDWYTEVIEKNKYHLNNQTIEWVKVIAESNNASDIIRHVWVLTKEYHERNAAKGFGNLDQIIETFIYMTKSAKGLTYQQYQAKEIQKGMFVKSFIGTNHAIKIQTIHSVKGLEYDTVFLMGLDNNIFPNERHIENFLRHGDDEGALEYISGERRLFYVGWTRAKKRLYVTFNEKNPSMFLQEVNHPQLREILQQAQAVNQPDNVE